MRALATIVDGRGQIFANNCQLICVEIDRCDHQSALREAHGAGSAATELDPRLLQLEQAFERIGHRTEAILQLFAQRADVGELRAPAIRRCSSIFACSYMTYSLGT